MMFQIDSQSVMTVSRFELNKLMTPRCLFPLQ
jgi:hypothetical protein